MKTSVMGNVKAVLFGTLTVLGVSMGLAAVMAALIGGGILPISATGAGMWLVTLLSALLGALVCAGKAGEKRLPLCLVACGVYLLLVFILRGLVFGVVSERPWMIPLAALAGSVLGALASSRKKRRKY